MTEKDFVYWLQGFVELTETDSISEKQWLVIKDHLNLVFDKKTPDRSTVLPTVTKLGDINWEKYNTDFISTVTC